VAKKVKTKVKVTVEVDVRLMAAIPDGAEACYEMSEIIDNDRELREDRPDAAKNMDLVADFLRSIRNEAFNKMFATE
jgi:hypothetical protein